MSRVSLESKGAKRQAIEWSVGLPLSILIGSTPIGWIIDAFQIGVDLLLDPYGLLFILTRGFVDSLSKISYDALLEQMAIQKKTCLSDMRHLYRNLPPEVSEEICGNALSVWKIKKPDTTNERCFGNYNKSFGSEFSGPPEDGCTPEYINLYNEYTNKYRAKYVGENIVNPSFISTVVKFEMPDSNKDVKSNFVDITDKVKFIRNVILGMMGILILLIISIIIFIFISY